MTADGHSLPFSAARQVDLICDQFEEALQAGKNPRIEEFIRNAAGPERASLLRALLAIELELLGRVGKAPSPAAYQTRFPEDTAIIEQVFRDSAKRSGAVDESSKTRVGNLPETPPSIVETVSVDSPSAESSRTGHVKRTPSIQQPVEFFGKFTVKRVLGKGGFGIVYHAYDPQLERDVAIKVPHASSLGTQELRDRFLREARATAALRHVNICPIFEIGEVEGQPFIAMAFIDGLPLSSFISVKKPLSEKQIASIVRKVALGLATAHHENVIHRDLKPDNIMIDRKSKEPVVMDFGLARRDEPNDVQLTQEGQIMGTPVYMPPEQAKGEVDKIGPHSDIYSLGVILYEMLSCQRPFQGGIAEVLAAIVRDQPVPPSKYRPGLDPVLEAICLKAMSKQPKDRYQTMAEFAQALTDFMRRAGNTGPNPIVAPAEDTSDSDISAGGLTVLFGPSKSQNPVKKSFDKKKLKTRKGLSPLWKTAIGLSTVMLLILLSVILLQTKHGYVQIEILDPSLQITFEGETITADNDGKSIKVAPGPQSLFVTYEGLEVPVEKSFELKRKDTLALRVTRLGNEVRLLMPGDPTPESISELKILGIELVQTLNSDPKVVWDLAFSPDGTRLAAANEGTSVKVWNPQDGALIYTLGGFETPVLCVAYSPDGTMLATGDTNRANSGRQRSGTAVAWNTSDWSQVFSVNDSKAVCSLAFSPDGSSLVGGLGGTMPDDSIARMEESYERMSSRPGSSKSSVSNSMSFKTWQWGGLMIYNLASMKVASTPSVDSSRITAVAVSPDGKQFVTSGFRGELKLRDASNGNPLVDLVQPRGSQYAIHAVAFASNQPILAGGAPNGFLIYNTAEKKEVLRNTTAGEVHAISFSDDGRILATGHEGQAIQLWDTATGKLLSTLEVDWKKTTDIEFQPGGDLIAAAGESKGDVRIWRINIEGRKQSPILPTPKRVDIAPASDSDPTPESVSRFTPTNPPSWSHVEIQAGKITAPILPADSPIWEDNFISNRNFIDSDGDVTCRIRDGFGSLHINTGDVQFVKELRFAGRRSDVACLVEAKLSGQNVEGWSFLLTDPTSGQRQPSGPRAQRMNPAAVRTGVEFVIGWDGTLRILPLGGSDDRVFSTIVHPAIKKGTEPNQLLVIARGQLLEVYVNGVAVCNPIVWQSKLTDLGWALGIHGKPGAQADFDSIKIWPSSEFPTMPERISQGQLTDPSNSESANTPEPLKDYDTFATGEWKSIMLTKDLIGEFKGIELKEDAVELRSTLRLPQIQGTNVILRCRVNQLEKPRSFGLFLRSDDTDGKTSQTDGNICVTTWINDKNDVGLFSRRSGDHKNLTEQNRVAKMSPWIEVAFAAVDDEIITYIAGRRVNSSKIPHPAVPGLGGMWVNKGAVQFKDIEYMVIDKATTRTVVEEADTINLLAAIDVKRDVVSGKWTKENGILLTPVEIPRQPPPRLYLPFTTTVPDEYDVELELERKQNGGTGLVFGFLFGGRQGTVHMDSYSPPHLWGINDIDGKGAKENSTRNPGDRLPLNDRKKVKIEIRKGGVRVFCDAEKVIDWQGTPEQLSTKFWDIPNKNSLFLGSQSAFAIHAIKLTPMVPASPEGTLF